MHVSLKATFLLACAVWVPTGASRGELAADVAVAAPNDNADGASMDDPMPIDPTEEDDDDTDEPMEARTDVDWLTALSRDERLTDMAPLLGQCPKRKNTNEDEEGAWCDSEHMIKCCNHKCRYRTSKTSWAAKSYDTEVSPDLVDKAMELGLHPSALCCRETITLGFDGVWSCRKAGLPMSEKIGQIARGPLKYQWMSFAQTMVHLYDQGPAKLERRSSSKHFFHKGVYTAGEALARPMVMLLGGYSTGKTTMIKTLLGREYRGMHIGVEPTTDRFTVVQHSDEEEGTVPGEILAVDPRQQFETLSQFGNGFLRSFQGSKVNSPVLQNFSIVDTPGVLSGEKQFNRDYDFLKVSRWFADRADIILLMFDVAKIDISDELKKVIKNLGPNQNKVRIILNKADALPPSSLLRSYGGLMYGLGRVFDTPELKRIYVGSFRDGAYSEESQILHSVFEDDRRLLNLDLAHLAQEALMEKINKFIQRVKLAKAHATLLDYLYNEMPMMYGKEAKKRELIDNLAAIYEKIEGVNGVHSGDLPDVKYMQEHLLSFDFGKIKKLRPKDIEKCNDVLKQISDLTAVAKEAFAGKSLPSGR